MKSVKVTANLLFYLTRLLSLLFLLTGSYISLVIGLAFYGKDAPIAITGSHFVIFYPFTRSPFVLGDYTTAYLSITITLILLYAIFLWLLSSVFHAFRQERLFTQQGVSRLQRFYTTNLTVPFVFLLLLSLFQEELRDGVIIGFLHAMIGVFAFFMAAIFRQGVLLQEEQDLTL